jgi:hypothetical protein
LDGNAFVVKSDVLIELTKYCRQEHPNLRKVSSYAHVKDIFQKSDDDLKQLSDAGFTMVYVGIESGRSSHSIEKTNSNPAPQPKF